jgi:hypothetical protein
MSKITQNSTYAVGILAIMERSMVFLQFRQTSRVQMQKSLNTTSSNFKLQRFVLHPNLFVCTQYQIY